MANLILTDKCQRKCEYCFAQHEKNSGQEFTWEGFAEVVKFISTGPRALNLLGGEPTLHPRFMDILESLIVNDFMVQVFTNGMVSEKLLMDLIKFLNRIALRDDQLFFAVNINEYEYRTEEEIRLQNRFMDNLGRLVYPSFTIHNPDVDLTFLADIVDKFYLDNSVRLGLSMPIVGARNKYLPKEGYRRAAKSIIDFARNTNVNIIFDCGFPLCMFELEELSELNADDKNDFSFICGCPLDIYPDLTATNCYPLSKVHKKPISEFSDIMKMYKYFEDKFDTSVGMYEECAECQFFKKACFGGCKGHIKCNQ
jgi:sulfatase maturation enzyme AslB (radical SAM superfamily)